MSKIKLKYKDKVYIKWLDHCGSNRWIDLDNINPNSMVCETTAWFIKETKRDLVVSHSFSEVNNIIDPFIIVKATIIKLRRIERAEENE